MAFKNKTKNRLLIDERQTLDAKHNNILKSFTNNKDNLNTYYKELTKINTKLTELNTKNALEVIINIELQIYHIAFYILILDRLSHEIFREEGVATSLIVAKSSREY